MSKKITPLFVYVFFLFFLHTAFGQHLNIAWGKRAKVECRKARALRGFIEDDDKLIFVRAARKAVAVDYYDKVSLNCLKSIVGPKFRITNKDKKTELIFQYSLIANGSVIIFASEEPSNKKDSPVVPHQAWASKIDLKTGISSDWKMLTNFYCENEFYNSDDFSDISFISDKTIFFDVKNKMIVTYGNWDHRFLIYDENFNETTKYTEFLNKYVANHNSPKEVIVSDKGTQWIVFIRNTSRKDMGYSLCRLSANTELSFFDIETKLIIPQELKNDSVYIDNALSYFKIINDSLIINYGVYNKACKHQGSFFIKYNLLKAEPIMVMLNQFEATILEAMANNKMEHPDTRVFKYFTPDGLGVMNLSNRNPLSACGGYKVDKQNGSSDELCAFCPTAHLIPRLTVDTLVNNISLRFEFFYKNLETGINSYYDQGKYKTDRYINYMGQHGPILAIDYDSSGVYKGAYKINKKQINDNISEVYDIFNGFIPYNIGNTRYMLFNDKSTSETFRGGIGTLIKNAYFGYHIIDSAGNISRNKVLIKSLLGNIHAIPITSKYYSSGNNVYLLATTYSFRKKYRLIKVSPK